MDGSEPYGKCCTWADLLDIRRLEAPNHQWDNISNHYGVHSHDVVLTRNPMSPPCSDSEGQADVFLRGELDSA